MHVITSSNNLRLQPVKKSSSQNYRKLELNSRIPRK
jgi:hypothetical protein